MKVTHYKLKKKTCFLCYKSDLIGKLSNLIVFMVAEYAASEFTYIYCAVIHTKEENICLKKVKKHKIQDGGMFIIQNQDGRYFFLNCNVFTNPQMYISFESITNLQRFDF